MLLTVGQQIDSVVYRTRNVIALFLIARSEKLHEISIEYFMLALYRGGMWKALLNIIKHEINVCACSLEVLRYKMGMLTCVEIT